jgi:hypothetical protein
MVLRQVPVLVPPSVPLVSTRRVAQPFRERCVGVFVVRLRVPFWEALEGPTETRAY